MIDQLLKYMTENGLFLKQDKLLLAVSGGKDSMVMLDLFRLAGFNIGVAHCNFKLRPEADREEELVRTYCDQHQIPCYTTSFDTQEYADRQGISIQMAARELRYGWFENIREREQFDYVTTAHHQNDVAETMLLNLAKGTGLAGLHGILPKSGQLIRPMLGFSRQEVDRYAEMNSITFLEDASNADVKYHRNAIRIKVIPELEKINPAAVRNLNKTAHFLRDAELILNQKIKEEFEQCATAEGDRIFFSIDRLKLLNPLATYLYYFLKEYGFNESQVERLIEVLDDLSGKVFESSDYQLVKDRKMLILGPKEPENFELVSVNTPDELAEAISARFAVVPADQVKFSSSPEMAYLDFDKLTFPLAVRNWVQGDEFQPFGMKGKKKVSDYFIDEKVDVFTKKRVKIITSQGEIVWLVGYRTDERFRVTTHTGKVLVLERLTE
ncbi:MAG: tRNA lysidine(34) synthetase TilS [Flavobacteriales bacterium]|nr:tRNA lysidine(34) synthetase TilS [Flavobacteriales bacterium]